MATHSGILAWKIPWTGSLVGYSPWDSKELDMTERRTLSLRVARSVALVEQSPNLSDSPVTKTELKQSFSFYLWDIPLLTTKHFL